MAMNFNVTPEELNQASVSLEQVSRDFLSEVKSMYSTLEDLRTKWEGAGSSSYYGTIENYRNDIEALGKLIMQYSEFLNKAAVTYNDTDSTIAQSAGRL